MANSGMTVLTPQLVYSFRNVNLLPLPRSVQDTIATLQLAPVQQGFVKKPKYQKSPRRRSHGSAGSGAAADLSKNWRVAAVLEVRKRMREVEDTDYAEVFAMLNKLAKQNYEKLSTQIFEILKKREEDHMFRLRIVSLMFGKGTENILYADLFANLIVRLKEVYPDAMEDLKVCCNIDTWKAMYAEDIVTLPPSSDPSFDDAVVRWTKQKERRRGFSRFMTELYIRELVDAEVMKTAIQTILEDLQESVSNVKTPATEEYVNQLSTFVFDTAKALKGKEIVGPIKDVTSTIVANAKTYSCLGMRAKFKLEDAFKLL